MTLDLPAFESGGLTISCTLLYPEQFDALRRTYDCERSMVESLARCVKFDASGGKSGSAFLKTLGMPLSHSTSISTSHCLKRGQTTVSSPRNSPVPSSKQWRRLLRHTSITCHLLSLQMFVVQRHALHLMLTMHPETYLTCEDFRLLQDHVQKVAEASE